MPFCSFSDNYRMMGVTPVENLFIQTYLPQAPGDYVRVYLYGLMQCYYGVDDLSQEQLAQALGLSPETVAAAFSYWERQGLVERMQDKPPTYRYIHPVSSMMNGENRLDKQIYRYQNLNAEVQKLIPDRPFSASDSDIVCQWVEDLGMPEEVVLIFVRHCIDVYMNREKGKKPENLKNFRLKNYDKEAMKWAEDGVLTAEKAQERVERDRNYYKLAQKVLKQLSISFRPPTRNELDMSRKWLEEYRLSDEAVLAACQETVKSRNPSFGYLDAILEKNRQARSQEQMQEQLEMQKTLAEGVKGLHRALGIQQMAPTPDEMEKYRMYRMAGFSEEALLLVARELGSRGQFDMEQFDRVMIGFTQRGQFSREDVGSYLELQKHNRKLAGHILEICGIDRKVVNADVKQLEKWLEHAPVELIEYAAECAHGTQLPLKYMEKTLSLWAKEGIDEVEKARAQHKAARPSAASEERKHAHSAHGYQQRAYDNNQLAYLFDNEEEDDA